MTAQRLLRNLMAQLSGEAGTDVKFPDFKRGHSRGAGRCDFNAGKQESWPTDAEIKVALDDGQNECIHVTLLSKTAKWLPMANVQASPQVGPAHMCSYWFGSADTMQRS